MDDLQLNLLILPLLGGFLFTSQLHLTSWYTARQNGERLIFVSAIAGVFLLLIARVIVLFLAWAFPCIASDWKAFIPFQHSGWAFGSFGLGIPIALLGNLIFTKDRVLRLLMNQLQSDAVTLERFFYEAVSSRRQVMLTLKDGKVYVGFIREHPMHRRGAGGDYIRLMPTISGYRDPITKKVVFLTSYIKTYLELDKPGSKLKHIQFDDFAKLIPIAEVEIAGIFDPTAYETFEPSDATTIQSSPRKKRPRRAE